MPITRPVERPSPQLRLLPRNDLEAAYREWKAEHPEVYALFLRFARERLTSGRRFGIGALTERVRWEVDRRWTHDRDNFRCNNNHRAYIARDLVADEPRLAPLIQMRRTR